MKRRKTVFIQERVPVNCPFCKERYEPSYKKYDELKKYMTERAKILGRARTGICTKHQRRLTVAVKHARHLGLLPFTPSV